MYSLVVVSFDDVNEVVDFVVNVFVVVIVDVVSCFVDVVQSDLILVVFISQIVKSLSFGLFNVYIPQSVSLSNDHLSVCFICIYPSYNLVYDTVVVVVYENVDCLLYDNLIVD